MKKFNTTKKYLICLLVLAASAGCGKNSTKTPVPDKTEITTQDQTETASAEPLKTVDSPESFLDINVFIDVPKNSEKKNYAIVNGNIAQIDFQYAETQYILRGCAKDTELAWDVNDEYNEVQDTIDNGKRKAIIKTTKGGCRVAEWKSDEGTNFMLMSLQPVELDAFNDICMWLAFPE